MEKPDPQSKITKTEGSPDNNQHSGDPSSTENENTLATTDENKISEEAVKFLLSTDEKTTKSIMVNPTVVESLAQHDPSALIEFADASDNRQYLYHTKVEECRHKEYQVRENTVRWFLAGLGGIIVVCFIYAGVTKDKALPNELIKYTLSAIGGAGALKLYEERKK